MNTQAAITYKCIKKIKTEHIKQCLYERPANSHKGTYGYIALIGGNIKYSGAIRLANMASDASLLSSNANCAMRAGSGVVKLAAPISLKDVILPNILESTFYPLSDDNLGNYIFNQTEISELIESVSVVAIGMGIGNSLETEKLIEYLLKNYSGILLIDADGLNALSNLIHSNSQADADYSLIDNSQARIIITPHPKEFSRISSLSMETILKLPANVAYDFAKEHKVITLLKGNITYVSDGNDLYQVDRGCPGMATAGSGDVLSGVISAICGYNRNNLLLATAVAAYVTGYAGELAQEENGAISMIASDTARHIALAIHELADN